MGVSSGCVLVNTRHCECSVLSHAHIKLTLYFGLIAAASKAAVDAESYELCTCKGGAWWHEPAGCVYQWTVTGEQGKHAVM